MNRRNLIYSFARSSSALISFGVCAGCMRSRLGEFFVEKSGTSRATAPTLDSGHEYIAENGDNFGNEDLSTPLVNDSENIPTVLENRKALSEEELFRINHFDEPHPRDLYLDKAKFSLATKIFYKINKVQRFVGHGRFNLIDLQEMFDIATTKLTDGDKFKANEIAFIEELFFTDAKCYGFLGKKLLGKVSDKIAIRDVIKVPGSGHYLFRDVSYPLYEKIIKDVGDSVILTSGVRGVSKQLFLFLNKLISTQGNLSQSSRSLAPPGYSYHAVGDFDVGKRGLGGLNFTNTFSTTEEYKKLINLGYIDIRYPSDNPYGVRFEPWHIEGVEKRI